MEEYRIHPEDPDEKTRIRFYAQGSRSLNRKRMVRSSNHTRPVEVSEFVSSVEYGIIQLERVYGRVRRREETAIQLIRDIELSGRNVPGGVYRICTFMFRNRMMRQAEIPESLWVVKIVRMNLYLSILERSIEALREMHEGITVKRIRPFKLEEEEEDGFLP